MSRVAIVTDSASDLSPATAAALGVQVVPLMVTFGTETFRAGVDLSTEAFWARMTAPDAPFPKTAASSPIAFREAFEAAFAEGSESVVCVDVGATLSGTFKSATLAREMFPDREIHLVDSRSASMGVGLLVELAVEMAAAGESGAAIAAALETRLDDVFAIVCLDTLEYLKKGGRVSGTQAAIGTLLSVKPIIRIDHGVVETVDRVRTRSKARERAIELLTGAPLERLAVLHTLTPDAPEFLAALLARVPGGIDPARVSVEVVGPSIGPHLGPGAVGAAVMRARA
jgi:DegV family protein with EDD domain